LHLCPFLLIGIALLVVSLLFSPPARAEARDVTVGVYENAPKIFTAESGQPAGIFIDLIENIAKTEGWKLHYVHGTWGEGLARLEKGEIDLMPDVAYTAEREKVYSFHRIPVLNGWSQVYARKGSGIQSFLDLNGKRIIVLEQTIQLETFRRLANSFELKIHLIPVPDYKTGFQMIADGKADAGVTNRFYGLMNGRKYGLEDTPVMFDPAQFFFAAPEGRNQPLLDAIDRNLALLKKDPKSAYYASLERWTSEEVRFKLPAWLKAFGVALGMGLVASLVGAVLLKSQVKARTLQLVKINNDLTESEQRYRHLFEHNPAPMLIYQRGTLKMLAVNDAFVTHYGYSREAALSYLLTDLYPEEEKEKIATMAAGLKGLAYAGEWHHRKADGSIITIMVRSHDIEYWGYNARIAVISDVTEMKQMEAQLRNVNETLDKKVRERTAQLEQKNLELEEANGKLTELDRLKSMFIASMSHELRTPLNSIIGFTGILIQGLAGPLNDEQRKQLGMVKGSSQHLLELITDIIDLSKIEAGKITLNIEPFDLAATTRDTVESFRVIADRKSLKLVVEGPEQLRIENDVRRLKQVLVNLVGNAVKFTEKGEVRVAICTDSDSAMVVVRDSGPGIKAEDMAKLFRYFSQITSADLPKHEGTGLGLYISRKLMNLLGGDIQVESEFGRGSTFAISLPLQREERP
jgi:PAS domain S-box-containing protein